MNKKLIIIFFLCSTFFIARSQTQKTIDSLAKINQDCLDGGRAMTTCASVYYHQMDSLLNAVYQKLYLRSDSSVRIELKKEQLRWLKKRNQYFKKIEKENKKEAEKDETLRHLNTMTDLQDEATFVQERVEYLLKRL